MLGRRDAAIIWSLKAMWTKGNAAVYAVALELLKLYIVIEFFKETTKDDEGIERDTIDPIVYFYMIAPMIFGFLANFRQANQVIDNATGAALTPFTGYKPSKTLVDTIGKNWLVRWPLGLLGAGSIATVNLLATLAYRRELKRDHIHDSILQVDMGLNEMSYGLTLATLIAFAIVSFPSIIFAYVGDLTETHPSFVLKLLKKLLDCYKACFKRFCLSEEEYDKLYQEDEYTTVLKKSEITTKKSSFVARFIEYFLIYTSSALQILPLNQLLFLYPTYKALDSLDMGDDWTLGLDIALIPLVCCLGINAALNHIQIGRNLFVDKKTESDEYGVVVTSLPGLSLQCLAKPEKIIRLTTASSATIIKLFGITIAIATLLDKWFHLNEVARENLNGPDIPVVPLLILAFGSSAMVYEMAFGTFPVRTQEPGMKLKFYDLSMSKGGDL